MNLRITLLKTNARLGARAGHRTGRRVCGLGSVHSASAAQGLEWP